MADDRTKASQVDCLLTALPRFADAVVAAWRELWSRPQRATAMTSSVVPPPDEAIRQLVALTFWASVATEESRPTRVTIQVVPLSDETLVSRTPGDVGLEPPPRIDTASDLVALAPTAGRDGALLLAWDGGTWQCIGIRVIVGRQFQSDLMSSGTWRPRQRAAIVEPTIATLSSGALRCSAPVGWLLFLQGGTHEVRKLRDADTIRKWLGGVSERAVARVHKVRGERAAPDQVELRVRDTQLREAERHSGYALDAAVAALVRRAHGALLLFIDGDEMNGVKCVLSSHRVVHLADLSRVLNIALLESSHMAIRPHGPDPFPVLRTWAMRVADMASVDGAVAINSAGAIVAFRTVIGDAVGGASTTCVDEKGNAMDVSKWGTRRRSALRFVAANRTAIAIAVSQDGNVGLFSGEAECVRHSPFPIVEFDMSDS